MSKIREDIPSGAELAELNQEGQTVRELARKFGCSRGLVTYRIKAAGYDICPPKDTPTRTTNQGRLPAGDYLLAEYEAKGAKRLADQYGVTSAAVFAKLHRTPGFKPSRHNMQTGAPRIKLPPPDCLVKEYNDNKTIAGMAKKYGVSASTIYNRLRESTIVRSKKC